MKKIYLDTNVISQAQKRWTGKDFQSLLDSKGFQPSVGYHVIYEGAKNFLSDDSTEIGKQFFWFLGQLANPHYVPENKNLIKDELLKARTGALVLYVMPEFNRIETKQEILRLAHGYKDLAEQHIRNNESKVRMDRISLPKVIMQRYDEFIQIHPDKRKGVKTFAGYKNTMIDLQATLRDCLRTIGSRGVPDGDLRTILNEPDEFPVIHTWLNCQIYLNYIPVKHRVPPSRSRLDDFCHVIACCASDFFVSHDERLLAIFSDLNPFRQYKSWTDFEASLG
jgi:hypothetical protein